VSGLGVTTEVIEYREGGDRTTIYLPGNAKYTPVKLSRAFTGDLALWDWYTTSAQGGHITRVTGTITMFDHAGQAVAKWNFVRGWPMKYKGPKLNAGSNDIPLETIEIVHEGLKVTRPDDTR
jgi:phage tail-like protein